MTSNKNNLIGCYNGCYDKGWYIEKFGWEFAAELENKLLDTWPQRSREKAINEYGINKVDEAAKKFCDEQIENEKKRLEDYYCDAMHFTEKVIHIMYDDDPKADDLFIDNLIKKRKEYEKHLEQIETDKMIYNSKVEAEQKTADKEKQRYGNLFD